MPLAGSISVLLHCSFIHVLVFSHLSPLLVVGLLTSEFHFFSSIILSLRSRTSFIVTQGYFLVLFPNVSAAAAVSTSLIVLAGSVLLFAVA